MPEWKAHGGSDADCEAIGAAGLALPTCFQTAGSGSASRSARRVALYHYATKSLEDFASKMARGSGMSKASKRMEYFAEVSRCGAAHRAGLCTFSPCRCAVARCGSEARFAQGAARWHTLTCLASALVRSVCCGCLGIFTGCATSTSRLQHDPSTAARLAHCRLEFACPKPWTCNT